MRLRTFRRRSNLGTHVVFFILIAAVIAGVYFCIVHFWANPKTPIIASLIASPYFVVPLVSVISGLFFLFRGVRAKTIWLPACIAPLPGGDDAKRLILRRAKLKSLFEVDNSCEPTSEDGWVLRGSNDARTSVITYRKPLDRPLTIMGQLYALVHSQIDRERYWRYGFTITIEEAEAICFHIDDENRLVGRVDGAVVLKTVTDSPASNNWHFLQLTISWLGNNRSLIHGTYDGKTYVLGGTARAGVQKLTISGWSDEHSGHEIYVRDISLDTAAP